MLSFFRPCQTHTSIAHQISLQRDYSAYNGASLPAICGPLDTNIDYFGGLLRVGEYLGGGEFGRVHRLHWVDPSACKQKYVVKASSLPVDAQPYLWRKKVGAKQWLYIMREADNFEENKFFKCLGALVEYHRAYGRAHGDVSPGNFDRIVTVFGRRVSLKQNTALFYLERCGWEQLHGIKLLGTNTRIRSEPSDFIIDPDIGDTFGQPKLIARTLHEHPRHKYWSAADDVIGLYNSMLLACGVKIERLAEDYVYSGRGREAG